MELQQKIDRIIEILRRDARSYRGKYHVSRRFRINNYFFTIIFLILGFTVNAQISQGGFPMELPVLKSQSNKENVVRMPSFEMPDEVLVRTDDYGLKSLTFAHTFNVELGLQNAGQWIETANYRVWQLQIESDGAKSIGLVFSEYRLPLGARLYLFDPEMESVMGAFTSENNKAHGRMATFPLAGDKLVLQYEEPVDAQFRGELKLAEVNHDYVGVTSQRNRWPRRLSGDCNVDVNCENVPGTQDLQRAVCRVLVSNELGTGTLLNNTANDGRPFLISAFHVFKSNSDNAEIAVFDFNYESPFCTGIDGYDLQTVSGSEFRAAFDSLDFMLVELSELPPPSYRPYFAGWDAAGIQPHNSYTIHHPNGDTKKISHDADRTDSMTFARRYLPFGHWRVHNWEMGTTEAGSSGAVLLNNYKRVTGILTGGNASCSNLSFDAFSRFDKMWDYRKDSTMQLRYWLNPTNSNTFVVNGFDPYTKEDIACTSISNFMLDDSVMVVPNYLSQTKPLEIAERFMQFDNVIINGVAIGIKNYITGSVFREFTIKIFEGGTYPEYAIKQFKYQFNTIMPNAMNFFSFGEGVPVNGNFFISIEVDNPLDSIAVFQSNFRHLAGKSTMFVNDNGNWKNVSETTNTGAGASLLMQVTVCGGLLSNNIDSLNKRNDYFLVYPNPANNYIVLEFDDRDSNNQINIYDRTGRLLYSYTCFGRKYIEIDVSGFTPGIYIMTVQGGGKRETKKLLKL